MPLHIQRVAVASAVCNLCPSPRLLLPQPSVVRSHPVALAALRVADSCPCTSLSCRFRSSSLHLLEFLPLGSAPCIAAAAPFPDVPAKSFCEYVWTIKRAWWLPPSAAMTTPQRWMIRPTYTLLLLLFLLLPLLLRLLLLLPCVSSTCAWLPGWVPWCVRCRSGRPGLLGNPRRSDGSPAKVLLVRCLLSLLAVVRCCDHATKVDDTTHPLCYCRSCCCCS